MLPISSTVVTQSPFKKGGLNGIQIIVIHHVSPYKKGIDLKKRLHMSENQGVEAV
jgi:hypothetical protein